MKRKLIIIISTAIVTLAVCVIALITAPDAKSISVNPHTVYLEPDMIKLIEVKIFPENTNPQNIRYISSDKSVALAENGQIKGISPGYAEVHIEDIKSGVKSELIKVTVLDSIAEKLNTTTESEQNKDILTDGTTKEGVVYITGSGSKYHKSDCDTLKGAGIETSLEDAVTSGKTPCKKCNP